MNYIQNAYNNADKYVEDDIKAMENQIKALKEQIKRKKSIKKKRTPEMYEDSVRSFMKMFLSQSEDQQKAILDAFKQENDSEMANFTTLEAPKPKRQRKSRKKDNEEPQNESENIVVELKMTNETVELTEEPIKEPSKPKKGRPKKEKKEKEASSKEKSTSKLSLPPLETLPDENFEEDGNEEEISDEDYFYDPEQNNKIKSKPIKSPPTVLKEAPITPDLCEGDSVTDAGQCYITKKPDLDDDEYRKVIFPILQERIDANEGNVLHVFGTDHRDIVLTDLEKQVLDSLLVFGSVGLKRIAQEIFCNYELDSREDDPRIRHDLLVIATENLRKKMYKATKGAIQIEYYIFRDLYPYDEFIPYEGVSIRFRKAGPLDSLQERNYQSLYESAKKSYSGS